MKICEDCGNAIIPVVENFGQYNIVYCPDCYLRSTKHCEHNNLIPVKYIQNGKTYVKNLCKDCQVLTGSFLKQTNIDLSAIRTIDKDKHDEYHQSLGKQYAERITKIDELRTKSKKETWFSQHNEYLKSKEWQLKRDQVLRRDNYLCQACLENTATQVHHLSYDHWKQEPLFELVSICGPCHERITKIDQSR